VPTLEQLDRDRTHAENCFDGLKKQRPLRRGFATSDLHRCELSVHGVVPVYNWRNLCVRLAGQGESREANTVACSWILWAGGASVRGKVITLTPMHGEFEGASEVLGRVSRLLQG